jgi:hypothetical protein
VDDALLVVVRHVAEQRQHLDLLRDLDLAVLATLAVEVAERGSRKTSDGANLSAREMVIVGDGCESFDRILIGLEHECECAPVLVLAI